MLGPCAVFDLGGGSTGDYVTLPGGAQHYGSDCPVGAALLVGDALSWTSDNGAQGSVGSDGQDHNGCAAKGTCGALVSRNGLGGGWQLCFA